MRGGVAAVSVFLALLVAVPLAAAGLRKPTPVAQSLTVTASPHAAAAKAVRLTVTLRYEMQCNYAGAGPLVVTFPAALKLPAHPAAGTVQLDGKTVAPLVQGRRVTVLVPPHQGIMCDVMGPGSLALTFPRGAKLVNPAQAGSYRFSATHANKAFTGTLTITS
jgi:hypothetical protein